MSFFTGEYECKLDAKGRMVLPSKVKSNLPVDEHARLYIGKAFDKCLFLYTEVEFKKLFSKIMALSGFSNEERALKRTFTSQTYDIELDANGRILISKQFMAFAGIDREAVVVGMGDHLEIWNPELYEQSLISNPDEYSEKVKEKLYGRSE